MSVALLSAEFLIIATVARPSVRPRKAAPPNAALLSVEFLRAAPRALFLEKYFENCILSATPQVLHFESCTS